MGLPPQRSDARCRALQAHELRHARCRAHGHRPGRVQEAVDDACRHPVEPRHRARGVHVRSVRERSVQRAEDQAPGHGREIEVRSRRMRGHQRTIALAAAAFGMALTAGSPAVAQRPVVGSQAQMPHYDEPGDLANLPMLGRWRINVAKSTQNGSRANSDTFTWIFRIEGNKIRHDIYDVYPADKPSRSYAVMLNGSEAADPHEVGIGETISWWPISRSMFY